MRPKEFIALFREAFGERVELPLMFGYSDTPLADTPKIGGCLFKSLAQARLGKLVSFNADNVACGGGGFYTGFTSMPERVPNFVSLGERYKKTPEMVRSFIADMELCPAPKPHLNVARVDMIESFDDMEGLLFFATPDELAGLAAWAFYDNNHSEAVAAPFGSGCSVMFTMAVRENRIGGNRTFIGLFDPSVRPYVRPNELGFVIPRVRFQAMQSTMRECCLLDTHAWQKVKKRLSSK